MIWHYFPIGMRFPVADFSEETRRACWKVALSAAFASDATGTGLYEACESYDPISQSPVYICIVCYVGIKQSRAAGEKLHSLDALMTRLCLVKPLVQANDLESFGPYPVLAEIDAHGSIRPNENGAAFIPTGTLVPMQQNEGFRLLIASDPMQNDGGSEAFSRVLGTAAADRGFRVKRLPIAEGGEGTVRALIAGCGGRYESVVCNDVNDEQIKMLIGVLPGPVAVIEAADAIGVARITDQTPQIGQRSSFGVGMLIRKTLDLGYRKIWIALGGAQAADLGFGALSALGIRFADADDNTVTPCRDTLSRIATIDRSGMDPRLAQSELTLLYDEDTQLFGEHSVEQDEREYDRLVKMLNGDPYAPGSGAGGGLGFALAAVGGILQAGTEMLLDRIGMGPAIREADFVIVGADSFDTRSIRTGKASAAVAERLSDANRPGCLVVRRLETDPESLLRNYPKLKGVVACIDGEDSSDASIRTVFDRSILPMIGRDVANSSAI